MAEPAPSLPEASIPAAHPPVISIWRQTEFLKFWTGQTISAFGNAITSLALPLTAVLVLNVTPAQMGFLSAVGALPYLLVSLLAGAWIDRSHRRPIMLWADIGRAALLSLIPISVAFGFLHITLLYAIVIGVGVLSVFFDISYQAFMPALVGRERLLESNSKMGMSNSVVGIAGPGLAGWLVQLLSAPVAIAFDAGSFVVSALSLALIRAPEDRPRAPDRGSTLWQEIGEGLKVVFANRLLASIAGCTATANLFNGLWSSLLVLYLTRNLGITPALIGVFFAAGAPGALVGALLSGRLAKAIGLGWTIIGSMLAFGLSVSLILLAHGPLPLVMGILIISQFLIGLTTTVYDVSQVSFRQAITPNRLLGRVDASNLFLVWGALPLGGFLASALSAAFGVQAAFTAGILGVNLAFVWVLLSPVKRLKTQPEPAGE